MKTKVLLLAANPKETSVLRLGEEFREIKESIQLGKYRDNFELIQAEAVRPKDLRRLLLRESPTIIHFSGHSTTKGICLENNEGTVQLVPGKALANLLGLCHSIQCVILNSCHSDSQTEALATIIQYVIGMKETVRDDVAIRFSIGFYDALGEGKNIKEAFDYGANAIELEKKSEKSANRSLDIEHPDIQQLVELPTLSENKNNITSPKNNKNKIILLALIAILGIYFIVINQIPQENKTLVQHQADQESVFYGTVIKKGTPIKLSNVEVTIFGSDDSSSYTYTTGNDGFYQISIPAEKAPSNKRYRIVAKKEGFVMDTQHYNPGLNNLTLAEETTDAKQ